MFSAHTAAACTDAPAHRPDPPAGKRRERIVLPVFSGLLRSHGSGAHRRAGAPTLISSGEQMHGAQMHDARMGHAWLHDERMRDERMRLQR